MSDHLTGMDLRQLSVLEMGCGLGLAGISAALHGGCAWLWGGMGRCSLHPAVLPSGSWCAAPHLQQDSLCV